MERAFIGVDELGIGLDEYERYGQKLQYIFSELKPYRLVWYWL